MRPVAQTDVLADCECSVRDSTRGAHDPTIGIPEVKSGENAVVRHAENDDRWLGGGCNLTPVVASNGRLRVDMENSLCEGMCWTINISLPHRNCVQDVITRVDDLREVVDLKIRHNRLDLVNRTPVLAVEEALEAGEFMNEIGI